MEVLGIDIGGSGIKGAIVDTATGELKSERFRMDTPQPATPIAVATVIRDFVQHFGWTGAIGCAFPTIVLDGVCKSASNLSPEWVGVHIPQLFSAYCSGQTFAVGNDADFAGLAEATFGAGKDQKGMVMLITVGTGLGSAAIYNGQLIPNFELGHLYRKGGDIMEAYASDAARRRDGLRSREWAVRFDMFLHHLNRIFSPNLVILGGGQSKKFDKFKDVFTVETPIVPAHFRNNAGIIGAAIFAATKQKAVL